MQTIKKRSFRSLLPGFFMLSHPVPMLSHLVAVTLFTLLAAWPHPVWPTVGLIAGAYLAMQMAIAMLNDYCDRKLDAIGKPWRPIPRGLVTPREAVIAGCLMIVLMAVLLLFLPPLAGLIALCFLALGQIYNFRLKSTPLSGVVFALSMPLTPLYAFAAVQRNIPFLIWLVPLGFLLGVALNLANALPDLEDDEAGSARTLAVVLGLKRSFLVGNTLLLLSALLILLLHLTRLLPIQPQVLIGTLALTALLLVAILVFTGARKPRATRKIYFYLVILVCIVLSLGWLIGALI